MSEIEELLAATRAHALAYIEGLAERDVSVPIDRETMIKALGPRLNDEPLDPREVIDQLVDAVDPGLVATTGGRFFGFVIGGVLPAALAADWLTSTWDQNPGFHVLSPAAALAEETVAGWLLELFGLPDTASVGFTTGAQMANNAGLAAARHHVLANAGWDVEGDGLMGAPPLTVLVGDQRHVTVDRALRLLGLGANTTVKVATDDQGAMDASALASELKNIDGPTIVCAQAGNVNSGAFDPFRAIAEAAHENDAWVHVDGAFGLWAAASPQLRHLTDGVELCDSWGVDGHKWLNVPYDSAFIMCAHPESHRAAMTMQAAYLVRGSDDTRDGSDWTPESSRRARVFATWAALRSLGRHGVAELIDRCCEHARTFAVKLGQHPDVEILNDVVLNQVLVRFGDDERTKAVAETVQKRGGAWFGHTSWDGKVALRISVSDHATTADDVDRAVAEIEAAL
ncbi:MAG: pyridoxal phosphate-dependent decarboxylase family protein [Actinomycetota bacterium]